MSKGIKIGKAGINPTIPVCYFCEQDKGEIVLTGIQGEEWAKNHGYADGHMPMRIWIHDDFEPCAKCKEQGIGVVEVDNNTDRNPTFRRWLVKEEAIKRLLEDKTDLLEKVLQTRVLMLSKEVAEFLGFNKQQE